MSRNQTDVSSILGLKDKVLESKQVIDSFAFDSEIYKDIYERSASIQQSVAEGDEIIRTYPELAQDIFMSLYKHKPKLLDEEDVAQTHQFNRQLMEELMEMDEFRQLRSRTRHDMISSALGFEVMNAAAVDTLRVYQQKMEEEMGEGNTPIDDINNQIDQQGDPNAPGAGGQPDGMSDEAAQQLAQQQAQQAKQKAKEAVQEMKTQIQAAANQALDDVTEMRDFLQAWGMEEGESGARISYENKKRALQRIRHSPKLKDLSDLVGRMKRLAINEKPELDPDGAEAITSVKLGDDLRSVLPSELSLLASDNANLMDLFYRKYSQQELLQYDKDVYETKGKGPIIACVDVSGSMQQGNREPWSKAVALSLLEVAQKQKRNFACMHYSYGIDEKWIIPHGELNPEDVLDIAERFSGGGTDFEMPLRESMEIMKDSKYTKGDIVFITDGDSYLSEGFVEEFNEAKKEKGFKVVTVLINVNGGGSNSTVRQFSDKIIALSDLALEDATSAADIFRDVKS